MDFEFANNHFSVLAGKALFWKEEAALVLSDLHIGKTQHFRKNGIPVPKEAADKNLEKLHNLLQTKDLRELIMVGDLFHSDLNTEWRQFADLRKNHSSLTWTLIRGNHDRIPAYLLKEAQIDAFHKIERGGLNSFTSPMKIPQNRLSVGIYIRQSPLKARVGGLKPWLVCLFRKSKFCFRRLVVLQGIMLLDQAQRNGFLYSQEMQY